MSKLEKAAKKLAVRHAKALGRAEATLVFIAAIAERPDEVRAAVAAVQAEINRIIAGEDKAA